MDCSCHLGLSSIQKPTIAMRILAYEVLTALVDHYVQIDESTTIESLKKFMKAIIAIFGEEYLR
ncbi:hypothetical protein Ddye_030599 [Dipteronia dyeriana]|uniref:Uncharacterized protein n=1 Tax=Dipteronia dyeriana TaxID=168575 RepID=A0AAD9WMP0_9ROSI|nr:hypothetical protein Ddye_030599 [Dipteronia dyeriana]